MSNYLKNFCVRKLREATVHSYIKVFSRFRQFYPDLLPQNVTQEHILKWRAYILKTATNTTYNTYARHLRSVFNFAIEQEILYFKRNPVVKTFLRDGAKKRKTFSDKQIKAIFDFLDYCEDLPQILRPRWFTLAIINTFRYTGIRRSQLVQLRVKDVSIDRGIIMIPAHINKNHNYHEIPISNKLRPYIEKVAYEHKQRRSKDDEQFFNLNKFSSYTLNRDQKMSVHQLQNAFVWISEKVGFKVSPHRFRHTIATQLMREPENLYTTKQLLNHSDVKVTMSYIEYNTEMIRNKIDELL
ncbi:tyrosine-type recombinase/integrase [Mannheimia haemolytica]|uniref:tyrosine-type recombinase/integrase n=1 Tax=Mannheimia haemolytica TaxID=75985 RepID=UPI00295F4C0F|nr:site-specific integrase [Mannheimia haemolytica]